MGMQVTRDQSQPDTPIPGPEGRQQAKAFRSPPNMAFTPLLSVSASKSDVYVTADLLLCVLFFSSESKIGFFWVVCLTNWGRPLSRGSLSIRKPIPPSSPDKSMTDVKHQAGFTMLRP